MVQAHVLHAGLGVARPTDDVDVVLHIETGAISWSAARTSLRGLGYRLSSRTIARILRIDSSAPRAGTTT